MSQLLNASFDYMAKQAYAFTFLIPQEKWLFGFYEKFGYKSFVSAPSNRTSLAKNQGGIAEGCSIESADFSILASPETTDAGLYKLYARFLSEIEHVVLKSERQFNLILQSFSDEKGILFYGEKGMAFTKVQDGKIFINEIFCPDEASMNSLLEAIRLHYHSNEFVFAGEKGGMIKPLNHAAVDIPEIYLGMMLD
jgi:predicted acetyltransferase